jgi:undecaprenyl-diphosphatase
MEISKGDTASGDLNFMIIFIGFLTAFISGYFACKWMINLVNKSKMIWFAIYCAIAGLLSILVG